MSKFIPLSTLTLVAAAVTFGAGTLHAALLDTDVSRVTYHDFGQNCGRYSTHNVNALLKTLTTQNVEGIESSGGVHISYTTTDDVWTMPQHMIDFSSIVTNGAWGAALGYNFVATVKHNNENDCQFSSDTVGNANAVHYSGIGYRHSDAFCVNDSGMDYKLTRMSKLITDVEAMEFRTEIEGGSGGTLYYRVGHGATGFWEKLPDGSYAMTGSGYGVTGGIMTSTSDPNGTYLGFDYRLENDISTEGHIEKYPLPFVCRGGDSGSAVFVWNDEKGNYQYSHSMYAYSYNHLSHCSSNPEWTPRALARFDVTPDLSGTQTINIYGANTAGTSITDSDGVVGRVWTGQVKDANNNVLTTYKGITNNINTWNSLTDLRDRDDWYHYGNEYLNATNGNEGSNSTLNEADLYSTQNLVFTAASAETYNIVLKENVDMGIGYMEFRAGEQQKANFVLSADSGVNKFSTAGFVVGENTHLKVTYTHTDANYMREWRKIGKGDLTIAGSENNEIFLNVGHAGTTYLQQTGGYAAYNVLANSGATVVIKDKNQIARNFTFGAGGATLDMNGNSMTWLDNDTAAVDEGFGITALTQDAVITNRSGSSVLTYYRAGAQTFLGSFTDTEDSSLKVVYDGGNGSSWQLNSIHTNLQHADSGLEVQSGTVSLVGTATKHGSGSLYNVTDDWHYADAKMNVLVGNGATFELGSHARLTGNVTVANGGNYIMREGVKHRYEYIEGWYEKEDTYKIRDYYGQKGNVTLASGANMQVAYNEGVTARNEYSGNISGAGNVSVDLGNSGASLLLSGQNTFSGTKMLTSGTLIAATQASLGDTNTNKWVVDKDGFLAVESMGDSSAQNILQNHIDGSSTGTFVLTADSGVLDMSQHRGLYIGAMEGRTIQYGTAQETLATVNGGWRLGGGGGTLVVNAKLDGTADNNTLYLGTEHAKGTVRLTNTANNNISNVAFNGGVTLIADSSVLGGAVVDLTYTNRLTATKDGNGAVNMGAFHTGSKGVLLLTQETNGATLNLSNHQTLTIGAMGDATLSGLTVANGAAYRLGGTENTLAVNTVLTGAHDLVVDGQTYSGGTVRLDKAATLTGAVTVMGYDNTKTTSTEGDISLSFGVNDALKSVSSVTLKNNGKLDLNGTEQTFNSLRIDGTGSVTNSAAETGTLNVTTALTLDSGAILSGNNKITAGTLNLTAGTTTTYDGVHVSVLLGADHNNWDNRRFMTGQNPAQSKNTTLNLYNGAVLDDRESYYAVSGTLQLNGSADKESTMYIEGIRLSDGNTAGTLNIANGVHLVVTGADTMTGNEGPGRGSFALSHWPHTGTVNLDGRLTLNSVISGWDGQGVINVKEGGEFNLLKGLERNTNERKHAINVNVADGGKLYAAGGDLQNNLALNLSSGSTLGGIATNADSKTVSFSNLSLGNADTAVTIHADTDIKTRGENFALNDGNGGTLQLRNSTTHGNLTLNLVGSGTLDLDNVTVSDGSLSFSRETEHTATVQVSALNLSDGTALKFTDIAETNLSGTINVRGNATIVSNRDADDTRLSIAGINVDAGKTLTIDEQTKNTIWDIASLNGAGNVKYVSDTANNRSSRLILSGEGNLSGTVTFQRSLGVKSRHFAAFMEIKHDKALQNAVLEIKGTANGNASVAINTANATIKGLNSGDMYSHVYSGSAETGVSKWPSSTSSNTLTITGSGTYTYSGYVNGDAAHALSIVMAGNGTQKFVASMPFLSVSASVKDVTALAGSLLFELSDTKVYGDVAVAQGATLQIGSSFSLDAGKTFSVLATDGNNNSANFNSTLVLNGGELIFDTAALSSDTAALSLSGLSKGTGVSELFITFNGESYQKDTKYWLSNRDWSAWSGSISSDDELTIFDATANGLFVTFATNYVIWNNSENDSSWQALKSTDVVRFDDTAANKDVSLSKDVTVAGLVFNNTEAYSIGGSGTITATGNMSVSGGGEISINQNLNVEGKTTLASGTKLSGNGTITTNTLNLVAGSTTTYDGVTVKVSTGADDGSWDNRRFMTGTNPAEVKETTLNLYNGAVLDDRNSYYAVSGTLNLNGKAEGKESTMYIEGIRLSDGNTTGTLNIDKGVHLVVTGNDAMTENGSDGRGSFSLSHWPHQGTVNVDGRLTINSAISTWHGMGEINVNGGAEFNLLRGLSRNTPPDRDNKITVNVAGGAALYAAGGTQHEKLTLNLASGSTLGGIAATEKGTATFANNMTVGTANTAGTLKIDTDVKTYDTTTFLLNDTTGKGGTIDLSGTIRDAGTTTLDVIGSGTLKLSGTTTVAGINLAGAQLELGASSAVSVATVSIFLSSAYEQANNFAAITGAGTFASAANTAVVINGDLSSILAQAPVPAVAAFALMRVAAVGESDVRAADLAAQTATYTYILWDKETLSGGINSVALGSELQQALEAAGWAWNEDFAQTGILTLTVPEPSAFGLLAGLGALALCVARRRRSVR